MPENKTVSRIPSESEAENLHELAREGQLEGLEGLTDQEDGQAEEPTEPTPARGELEMVGQRSVERIGRLHRAYVEVSAERDRLRKDLSQIRRRTGRLEEINLDLEHRLARYEAERIHTLELQQQLDRRDAVVSALRSDVHKRENELRDHEQRSDEIQNRLRTIGQDRAARIGALRGQIRAVDQSNAALEQQVEDLITYRQRSVTCFRKLTEELRHMRRDSRFKARRLAEARTILHDIDQRLASDS